MPEQGWQDVSHNKLLGNRREMNTADTREVRLHEMERILPAGAGEVAHRIEPAIDRIEALVILRPGVAKPTLFVGRDSYDSPDPLIFEIEVGEPFECFDQLKADVMHVTELLLHDEQWA